MSTAKEHLTKIIENQPDDSSEETIVRELAFDVMIRKGLADADAKRTLSNDEMARRIRKAGPVADALRVFLRDMLRQLPQSEIDAYYRERRRPRRFGKR